MSTLSAPLLIILGKIYTNILQTLNIVQYKIFCYPLFVNVCLLIIWFVELCLYECCYPCLFLTNINRLTAQVAIIFIHNDQTHYTGYNLVICKFLSNKLSNNILASDRCRVVWMGLNLVTSPFQEVMTLKMVHTDANLGLLTEVVQLKKMVLFGTFDQKAMHSRAWLDLRFT